MRWQAVEKHEGLQDQDDRGDEEAASGAGRCRPNLQAVVSTPAVIIESEPPGG